MALESIDRKQVAITFGRFKGQPLDLRTRRSIELVSKDDQHLIIDYFFHHGDFYRAKIPRNSVQKIHGQRFSFAISETEQSSTGIARFFQWKNPFINHAQVRFILEDGASLELYPLGTEEGEPKFRLNDFSYSVEVVGPKGVAWALPHSFGDMASAHRFLSTEEVYFERVMLGEYQLLQSSPLLLDKSTQNALLEKCLLRSDSAALSEPYYLVTPFFGAANCTSEPFKILDSTLKERYSWFQRVAAALLWRFPISLKNYLSLRGVVDPKIDSPTLNEELAELSKRPELLERRAEISRMRKKRARQ